MNILCLIFSWKGQYENALKLEKELSKYANTLVINSDDDNKEDRWVNIGNECYFSDQFRTALDIFNKSESNVLLHIQADASFDGDWKNIIDSAKDSFVKHNWGVYAPNVDDTFYISQRTDITTVESNLRLVATTDNTCWFVHKDIIEDMNANLHLMESNRLGWGWDLLICSFSHLRKRPVIRDYSFKINHPASTGYMKEQAEQEMFDMFEKCQNEVKRTIYLIKVHPTQISNYYNTESNDIIIINTENH